MHRFLRKTALMQKEIEKRGPTMIASVEQSVSRMPGLEHLNGDGNTLNPTYKEVMTFSPSNQPAKEHGSQPAQNSVGSAWQACMKASMGACLEGGCVKKGVLIHEMSRHRASPLLNVPKRSSALHTWCFGRILFVQANSGSLSWMAAVLQGFGKHNCGLGCSKTSAISM